MGTGVGERNRDEQMAMKEHGLRGVSIVELSAEG